MKKTSKPVSLFGLSPQTILGYPKPQPMETPGLQKAQRILDLAQDDQLGKESSVMSDSLTPNLDALFEKVANANLTEAQRRYPELLKVASPTVKTPALSKRRVPGSTVGGVPATHAAQSSLSGGAA